MTRFFRLISIAGCFCCFAAAAQQPVDWIVYAKYVVTMDRQHHLIENGAIAIAGARIAGVGTRKSIDQKFRAERTLDKREALVTPGLIDTHTHAPMSLMRAIADDKTLDDWLQNYIFPAESKNVNPDFVRWGTRLACLEMIAAGITTYTDMYYFEDIEAETAKEAGVRGVLGQTIIGFPAPDHKTWRETLAATEKYIQRFRNDELITPAIAPHAIYTTPDEALVAARKLADKYKAPYLIHLAETKKERDDTLAKRGSTPTEVLEKLGIFNGPVIAAHGVWESDNDLTILRRHDIGIAHCPSSNMKLASGVARVTDMLRLGIHVGLGTDGFAGSNDSADLVREMDLAAKLQKVTRMEPTALPGEKALEMATLDGARVLGLQNEIGSLEEGKRADLITISLSRANSVPLYNVYSQIVYASKAADVEDVFINGKEVARNGRVLTLNAEEIRAHANLYQRRIAKSIKH